MQYSLALLALAPLATARLVGLAAPSTIAPNQPLTLTLLTENYIQSVADVSIAWGFAPAPGSTQSLGRFVGSQYLGPSKSNQLKNVSVETTAPEELSQWKGKQVLLAGSLTSLYGALGMPTLTSFNVTVTIGDETSDELVRSNDFTSSGNC